MNSMVSFLIFFSKSLATPHLSIHLSSNWPRYKFSYYNFALYKLYAFSLSLAYSEICFKCQWHLSWYVHTKRAFYMAASPEQRDWRRLMRKCGPSLGLAFTEGTRGCRICFKVIGCKYWRYWARGCHTCNKVIGCKCVFISHYTYRSVLGKHKSRFWPAWVPSWDITSIHLYRSCYIDS